ncbi:Zinc protease [Roseomonas mucosa]|uniref:Zinc protease n=1 Tax=Roseomonas mucosa TaxID=207340 RepID=A0A4Y1MWQ3_9PROT|nr:pitrilysin family protein [Roseomonas mucosa]AWV21944.1 Zinc protease [Roseomonas mucosa]MDT8275449.1 pitrilysin family protein [Roseomonas mucosa]MDT8355021.1 pitrilysin family protein [Roseomonas mucosa]
MTSSSLTPPPSHPQAGFSLPIREVTAPGGLSAWLAEDHSVPVVSLAWSWSGGASLDPEGQEGAAALAAALLTEGAGDLPAAQFQDALRDAAIGLSFHGDRDGFEGGFRALGDALPEAVRLARLAMLSPRFDAEAVERVRARAIAGARQQLEGPRGQANRAFWAQAFPGSPYGRPPGGTAESLAALPVEAIRAAAARHLRRDGLVIAAAGAIAPEAFSALLAEVFGGLPEGGAPEAPPLPDFVLPALAGPAPGGGPVVVPVDAPQCAVLFGQPGLPVRDPDWEAAQVALRVLGGGGFSSRLMQEVRVKRGLSYGIGAGLDVIAGQGLVTGSVATENARVTETLNVLRAEWAHMAAEGPTQAELEEAVSYLTGSLPLQFTDSRRTASILMGQRRNGRPADWLAKRPERLAAMTRDGVARVAARVLQPGRLGAVVAGKPEGI